MNETLLEKEQLRVTLVRAEKNLEEAEARIAANGETIRAQNVELEKTKADMVSLNNIIGRLESDNRAISDRADKLTKDMDEMVRKQLEERNQLRNQLFATNDSLRLQEGVFQRIAQELADKKEQSEKKEAERLAQLNALEADLNRAKQEMAQREKRLNELEAILAEKDSVVNVLNATVSRALTSFTGSGLNVSKRDGKVYVSLTEQLLFASGSTQIDPRGRQALRELAKVLSENPDINVLIEGHTDDVPLNGSGHLRDNWDLSVLRATAVTRILTDGTGVAPARITAGGRSQFVPLNPEKNADARRANRRTEIILTPKLNDLFNIIK